MWWSAVVWRLIKLLRWAGLLLFVLVAGLLLWAWVLFFGWGVDAAAVPYHAGIMIGGQAFACLGLAWVLELLEAGFGPAS